MSADRLFFDANVLVYAHDFQVESHLSFWDASILAVAPGADELWSENFQTGRMSRIYADLQRQAA